MTMRVTVEGLFAGKVELCWPGKPASAIRKHPFEGRAEITRSGFSHDAQADLAVHCGYD